MAISLGEVERIAKLARLEFNDTEKQKFQQDLSSILDYVDQLKELQVDQVQATVDADAVNLMRDDFSEINLPPSDFLAQAPARQGDFVKVRSILE